MKTDNPKDIWKINTSISSINSIDSPSSRLSTEVLPVSSKKRIKILHLNA